MEILVVSSVIHVSLEILEDRNDTRKPIKGVKIRDLVKVSLDLTAL